MRKFLTPIAVLLALFAAMSVGGCASVINGRTQDITVTSSPANANIEVYNSKGENVASATAPATISFKRSRGYFRGANFMVEISKDGYETQTIPITSRSNTAYSLGNLALGGVYGWLIVDPITGAMYTLRPGKINASLTPDATAVATGDRRQVTVAPAPEPITEERSKFRLSPYFNSAYNLGGYYEEYNWNDYYDEFSHGMDYNLGVEFFTALNKYVAAGAIIGFEIYNRNLEIDYYWGYMDVSLNTWYLNLAPTFRFGSERYYFEVGYNLGVPLSGTVTIEDEEFDMEDMPSRHTIILGTRLGAFGLRYSGQFVDGVTQLIFQTSLTWRLSKNLELTLPAATYMFYNPNEDTDDIAHNIGIGLGLRYNIGF